MSERILVIDDDATYRERFGQALRSLGAEVMTAGEGKEALRVMQEFAAAWVVLDLNLNGESGLDLIVPILSIRQDARVLVLTGYGSIATAIEAVRKGAWDYLTKPADAEQVMRALKEGATARQAASGYQPPSLERLEWEHIQRVLREEGGNISRAAEVLGLHRRSLQRKLQKYPPWR